VVLLFLSEGDKLLTINGVDLQDLSPEAFAKILTEGNPMLVSDIAGGEFLNHSTLFMACFITVLF
jgi:hypothetical protein